MRRLALFTLIFSVSIAFSAEVLIPHLTAENASWSSVIQVDNYSEEDQNFTLTLFRDGLEVHLGVYQVPALSQTLLNLSELEPLGVCGHIEYESNLLQFRLSYESQNGGGLAEFALTESAATIQSFRFSDFSPSIEWKGIAIGNLEDQTAHATLFALGDQGILGSTLVDVGPMTRIRGVHSNYFPNLAFAAVKSFVLVSDLPVSGVAISGDFSSSKLLFTQSSELPIFPSMDQESYLGDWVGSWQSTEDPEAKGDASLQILRQEGSTFSGLLNVLGTDCGDVLGLPVSGSIVDGVFDFNISLTCGIFPVDILFSDGVVNESTLSGNYEQTVNGEFYDRGTFELTRVVQKHFSEPYSHAPNRR